MTDSNLPAVPASRSTEWWRPQNLTEAMEQAKLIASSAIVPKAYSGRPGDILVAMQMGAELGLSPMAALQNIAVINGRPSLWGDSMLAVCKAHPDWEWMRETAATKENGYVATCVVKRRGEPEHVATFRVEDAHVAGLWKKAGPWTQYPQRMLSLRARAFALRDTFPDALRGIASAEEQEDIVRTEATVVESQSPAPTSTVDRVKGKLAARAEPVVMDPTWDDPEPVRAETDEEAEARAIREMAVPERGEE